MQYETEEQQIEAIKRWWKENGTMVIAGIVLGLGAIFGWRYYGNVEQQHNQMASAIYDNVMTSAMMNGSVDEQQTRVNRLMAEFEDTPYASLSALVLARQQVQQDEPAKAAQQLEWVVANAERPEIRHIARLRLIRVLYSSGQYDKALALINIDYPASFAALYEELKGDLHVAKGELDQARTAYDNALLHSQEQPNRWLQLKRDDLGNAGDRGNMAEPSA